MMMHGLKNPKSSLSYSKEPAVTVPLVEPDG
jgi:hypothetical protein